MAYIKKAHHINILSTSFALAILLMIGVAMHAHSDEPESANTLLVTQIITRQQTGSLGVEKQTSNLSSKTVGDAPELGNRRSRAFFNVEKHMVNLALENINTVSSSDLLQNTSNFSVRTVRISSEFDNLKKDLPYTIDYSSATAVYPQYSFDNPRTFTQISAAALAVNKFPVAGGYSAIRAYPNPYFGDSGLEAWQCLAIRF